MLCVCEGVNNSSIRTSVWVCTRGHRFLGRP